jgi:hypothetical protein
MRRYERVSVQPLLTPAPTATEPFPRGVSADEYNTAMPSGDSILARSSRRNTAPLSFFSSKGKLCSPSKPNRLDVCLEMTEKCDGYTRQLLNFVSEVDDRIRAYLLTRAGLKEGEKRPTLVVFHQTTRDTLRESVGLGEKPEPALALHLVRRGYVTLSPEC